MTMKTSERLLRKACNEVNVIYIEAKSNPTNDEDEARRKYLYSQIAKKRAKILLRARIEAKLKSTRLGRQLLRLRWMIKQERRLLENCARSSPDRVRSCQASITASTPIPIVSSSEFRTTYRRLKQRQFNGSNLVRPRRNAPLMTDVRPPTTTSLTLEEATKIKK